MGLECFLCHRLVSSDVELAFEPTDTNLFEESRYTASDLHIADHELPVSDYLLRFGKVGYIAFIVDASCEVAGALLFIRPSRNYGVG